MYPLSHTIYFYDYLGAPSTFATNIVCVRYLPTYIQVGFTYKRLRALYTASGNQIEIRFQSAMLTTSEQSYNPQGRRTIVGRGDLHGPLYQVPIIYLHAAHLHAQNRKDPRWAQGHVVAGAADVIDVPVVPRPAQ